MERSTNLFHGTLHKLKNPINTIYILKKKKQTDVITSARLAPCFPQSLEKYFYLKCCSLLPQSLKRKHLTQLFRFVKQNLGKAPALAISQVW